MAATHDQFSRPSTNSKASLIARQGRILFSAYRSADFADPEGFVLQLGMVLEEYADEVIIAVTHPRTGLQRRSKFPPSIAEVVEACNTEAVAVATRAKYAAMTPVPRLAAPPGDRCSYHEMTMNHGRPIGRFEAGTRYEQFAGRRVEGKRDEFKRLTADDLRRIYGANDEAA